MYKSRKGAALVMALVVVLVGGALIAVAFRFVMNYSRLAEYGRAWYLDHTTLVSYVQAIKGRIIAQNLARPNPDGGSGLILHVPALMYEDYSVTPADESLTADGLRFTAAHFPPDTSAPAGSPAALLLNSPPTGTGSHRVMAGVGGVGVQHVRVEVYDMHFLRKWVNTPAMESAEYFPPIFTIEGARSDREFYRESEGLEFEWTGFIDPDEPLDPRRYGAYLIRAELYDDSGRRLRTIEEAFVQILPEI